MLRKIKIKKPLIIAAIIALPLIIALAAAGLYYSLNKIGISADSTSCSVQPYKQTTSPWGDDSYGYSVNDNTGAKTATTVAKSGCGPTAAAMVLKYWTGNGNINPGTTAQYCLDNGFRSKTGGPYNFPGCLEALAKHYNLKFSKVNASDAQSYLKWYSKGSSNNLLPIIMTVGPCEGQKYTSASHYIVLTKIVGDTVYINDPNKNNTSDSVSNIFGSCKQNGYWYIHK